MSGIKEKFISFLMTVFDYLISVKGAKITCGKRPSKSRLRAIIMRSNTKELRKSKISFTCHNICNLKEFKGPKTLIPKNQE